MVTNEKIFRKEIATKHGIARALEEIDNNTVRLTSEIGGFMEKQGSVLNKIDFGTDLVISVGDMLGEYKIKSIEAQGYNSDTNDYSYIFKAEKVQPLIEEDKQ